MWSIYLRVTGSYTIPGAVQVLLEEKLTKCKYV
jgi:hypothetical protein